MRRKQIDYIKLAHEQLDEWIERKIESNYWPYGPNSDVIDLGKLKTTMERARDQWHATHPPIETITIKGKKYAVNDIVELIKGKELS